MTDYKMYPFEETLTTIKALVPQNLHSPRVGIVCGSGLHTLAGAMRDVVEVPYASLPGFGRSTGAFPVHVCCEKAQWLTFGCDLIAYFLTCASVPGHKSALAFGLIGPGAGVPAVVMLGRVSRPSVPPILPQSLCS